MQGTKGAEEVWDAFWNGNACKRGNARTDGRDYYLFDNRIASTGPPSAEAAVRARLLDQGDIGSIVFFTFAGWATKSTERHLNAGNIGSIKVSVRRGRCYGKLYGKEVEISKDLWYSHNDIHDLIIQQHKEAV